MDQEYVLDGVSAKDAEDHKPEMVAASGEIKKTFERFNLAAPQVAFLGTQRKHPQINIEKWLATVPMSALEATEEPKEAWLKLALVGLSWKSRPLPRMVNPHEYQGLNAVVMVGTMMFVLTTVGMMNAHVKIAPFFLAPCFFFMSWMAVGLWNAKSGASRARRIALGLGVSRAQTAVIGYAA